MLRILLTFITFFLSIIAVSADISVSPLKHELTIDQSSSTSAIIKIKNDGDDAITLYSSKEDFIAGDDSGFPRFIKPEDLANPELSLTSWIEIENESVTLAPNETKEVRFKVTVPENGEPGGHYGVIFFGPETSKGAQLSVIQKLGVLILIDVPGEVNIAGEFTQLETGNIDENIFTSSDSFHNFPIVFSTIFENSGNTHLKPKGKIELLDEEGNILKQVGKEKIISQAGAFVGEKVVDYIPVNETAGNVLPDSKRRFNSNWEGFGFNVVNEVSGEKEVKFKGLSEYYTQKSSEENGFISFYQQLKQREVTKPITANYYLYFEGKDKEKSELRSSKTFYVTYIESYIGLNLVLVSLLILLIIGGGVYGFIILPKKRTMREENMRKKIMEEIKNNK